VDCPTGTAAAISLTVSGLLFGAGPAKRRPGYANFAIAEPPLKLVLLENPGQGGSLNHVGVEVDGTSAVDAEQTRLAAAGLILADEAHLKGSGGLVLSRAAAARARK
jgi:hypothetical protein